MENVGIRPNTAPSPRLEGRARLEAERKLLKRYDAEYRRLTRKRSHIDAVRSLVKRHSRTYGEMIRESLDRYLAERASRAA